jgi:hypothetical protein
VQCLAHLELLLYAINSDLAGSSRLLAFLH